MTTAERMTRYRWGLQLRATLSKAAALIERRPPGKELPLLPVSLVEAYQLNKKRYNWPTFK